MLSVYISKKDSKKSPQANEFDLLRSSLNYTEKQ